MRTVFTAGRLFTPTEEVARPLIEVEDGRIRQVVSQSDAQVPDGVRLVDFGDAAIRPGFLDIHIHGGAGVDLMQASLSDVGCLGEFLASHGVTGYFPTTVAAPLDAICAALDRLADAIEKAEEHSEDPAHGDSARARPLGIHLEGPD